MMKKLHDEDDQSFSVFRLKIQDNGACPIIIFIILQRYLKQRADIAQELYLKKCDLLGHRVRPGYIKDMCRKTAKTTYEPETISPCITKVQDQRCISRNTYLHLQSDSARLRL